MTKTEYQGAVDRLLADDTADQNKQSEAFVEAVRAHDPAAAALVQIQHDATAAMIKYLRNRRRG